MRRDEILQAAAQIFRDKGYDAASMQDIANAVGLQKPSLYHHVASKQAILLALLDQALDLLLQDIEQVQHSSLTPEDKLCAAIQSYVTRLASQADLAAVLLLEYRGLAPGARRQHIARRDRVEAAWRAILREGMAAGRFRQVDPDVAGFALLGVQNWMITWYRSDGRLSPSELANDFCDLFLRGLRPDTPPGGLAGG
jgi:AcrR family transcriptional regulator